MDEGCFDPIIGVLVVIVIVWSTIAALTETIIDNWSSITWFLGWLAIVAVAIGVVYGVVWYFYKGHYLMQEKTKQWNTQKEEKKEKRQQRRREEVWNETFLGKDYRKLIAHESEAQKRVDELIDAIKDNEQSIKKFRKVLQRSVVPENLEEDVQTEIKKINKAIETRSAAIDWYKAALSKIEFEKTKIDNAKRSFLLKGGASKNYQRADSFMDKLNELISQIEGNLEELYINNEYGYDEKIKLKLEINQKTLRSGDSDYLNLNQKLKELDKLKRGRDHNGNDV